MDLGGLDVVGGVLADERSSPAAKEQAAKLLRVLCTNDRQGLTTFPLQYSFYQLNFKPFVQEPTEVIPLHISKMLKLS